VEDRNACFTWWLIWRRIKRFLRLGDAALADFARGDNPVIQMLIEPVLDALRISSVEQTDGYFQDAPAKTAGGRGWVRRTLVISVAVHSARTRSRMNEFSDWYVRDCAPNISAAVSMGLSLENIRTFGLPKLHVKASVRPSQAPVGDRDTFGLGRL